MRGKIKVQVGPDKDETVPATKEEIQKQREIRLGMLIAAFVKEVGSKQASKFELVEVDQGNVVRWYFRRRKR